MPYGGDTDTTGDLTPQDIESGLPNWRNAIAKIESAGEEDPYRTVQKTSGALGRYQVMPANVPAWTKSATGTEMTPEAFRNDPDAQDKVFNDQFGKLVAKYGNPYDAASAWFTGRPQSRGANATDALNMTGARYVQNFRNALGSAGVNSLQSAPMTQVMPRTGASFGYDNGGYGYGSAYGMSPAQMNALSIGRVMAPYLGGAGPIFQLAMQLKATGLNGEDRTLTPVQGNPFESAP